MSRMIYNPWGASKELREFPARVSVTIEKDVSIPTDMYNEYNEDYDGRETLVIETNQVDWEREYQSNCITILDMLNELQQYVNNELRNTPTTVTRESYLYRLLDAASGWVEQNIEINEL